MQFLCNSRLRPGVTREQFLEFSRDTESDAGWQLTRKGAISRWHYKVGDPPGVAFIMNAATAGEVQAILQESPGVKARLLEFEMDPASPFSHFE